MKTAKLVTGIFSIIFSVVVSFQSCATGVVNALDENSNDMGGTAGLFVAILLLTGGITMIATRKSEKNGGSIACLIMFSLAAIVGFPNAAVYSDLKIWAVMALILAVLNLVSIITNKKPKKLDPPVEQATAPEQTESKQQ